MAIPRSLREQAKFYEKKGFHIIDVEPRNGAHFLVKFAEFPESFVLSKNSSDTHALLNNVAHYRRLKEKANETN